VIVDHFGWLKRG